MSLLDTYEQDSICGAWELFQRVVKAKSDDKVGWAESIGPVLGTELEGARANLSPSFRQLCVGLKRLVGEPV